jgi:hypothetical protein
MSKGILSWEGSEMSGEKRTITFQDLDALEVPENAKNRNSEGVKKVNERFFSDGGKVVLPWGFSSNSF